MANAMDVFPNDTALPTVPSVETWRAMTPAARMRFQVEVNTALTEAAQLISEGQPHKRARFRIMDALGLHFKTIGRAIYLAEELSVLYPNEKPFAPDILAVLDVEPSNDEDERMSWVVADEGKGIDLVIEVLHRGSRDKDLITNVERYARLGITEYFVYDRERQRVHGFRLVTPTAARYQPIVPQLGHYRSGVLGLDLAVISNNLRFLAGEAALPLSVDLISRLQDMVTSLETKADEAQAQVEEAQAKIDAAQAKIDAAQAKIDKAQADAAQAIDGMREALFVFLEMRAIACPDDARIRIQLCHEPATLRRWLARARTAENIADILSVESSTAR